MKSELKLLANKFAMKLGLESVYFDKEDELNEPQNESSSVTDLTTQNMCELCGYDHDQNPKESSDWHLTEYERKLDNMSISQLRNEQDRIKRSIFAFDKKGQETPYLLDKQLGLVEEKIKNKANQEYESLIDLDPSVDSDVEISSDDSLDYEDIDSDVDNWVREAGKKIAGLGEHEEYVYENDESVKDFETADEDYRREIDSLDEEGLYKEKKRLKEIRDFYLEDELEVPSWLEQQLEIVTRRLPDIIGKQPKILPWDKD